MFEDINESVNISEIKKEIEVNLKNDGIPMTINESFINQEEMVHLRITALKIAKDISISIYNNQKDSSNDLTKCSDDFLESLFKDLDIMHKIADYNLKYILGDN